MPESIPLFLAAVAIGCYIQTVTGFALGIFVLTVVTLTQVASIPVTASALNIMNLMLGSVVVLPRLRQVNWRLIALSLAGGLPAMALGVLALGYLDRNAEHFLHLLLGALIFAAGAVMAHRPNQRDTLSSPPAFIGAGALGGFFGGLFSIGGPPVVYQLYRQPIPAATLRLTLVALFSLTSMGRLAVVAAHGDLTGDVLRTGLMSLPVVALAAWLGRRYPPPLSERAMRRLVFLLLMFSGAAVTLLALL